LGKDVFKQYFFKYTVNYVTVSKTGAAVRELEVCQGWHI